MMIAVLAEPEVLLVFSAIVTATSTARPVDEFGRPVSATSYITPFGLTKTTSLPRDVIEKAAGSLARAGLLEVHPDPWGRFDSWRVDEVALVAASS
ncbi:MAG TPA: hypothetical protein VFC19_18540 [Candidatus Limnocylindrales bacterium]|nr:hypothetical protein [Candidatus Limnocylindrales bacterium]